MERSLLTTGLRLLSTLTNRSEGACQALTLTTPTVGAGPRRTPTGLCLLNVLADVVVKEMANVSRVNPLLKELDLTLSLLNNFAHNHTGVKQACIDVSLPDQLHKFFIWLNMERSLLTTGLRLLSTLTNRSEGACQALTLTTPTVGAGPRRTPTGLCLLNVLADVVVKEMANVSRARDLTVLEIGFEVLNNVCCATECRTILAKQANLLQSLTRVHPAITKQQKPWNTVERLVLDFLQTWTFSAEGQTVVGRRPDLLDLLYALANGSKSQAHRKSALHVVRNVAFHHSNRVVLLSSVEFLQLLQQKLSEGSWEEKETVITIIWTLTANNQRSKNVIRCTGLDNILHDIVKHLQLHADNAEQGILQQAVYVLGLIRDTTDK